MIRKWSGDNTYRIGVMHCYYCKNNNTRVWYIKLRAFGHNWQFSNSNSLPSSHWKDKCK
jgi:hypothetical protein